MLIKYLISWKNQSKSNHIACYYDKICDVAERKYGFENSPADNYFDFCINNSFITPANSRGMLSYSLVAVPDISEDPKLVNSGSATLSSYLNERRRR